MLKKNYTRSYQILIGLLFLIIIYLGYAVSPKSDSILKLQAQNPEPTAHKVFNKNLRNKPNVILIVVDTLRADHLSCYGYNRETSPHIDELAKNGSLFLNAFSQIPRTTPSTMSIMTSLHHEIHQLRNYFDGKAEHFFYGLNNSIPTLAKILKKNGYTTVAFTGGTNVHSSLGFDKGFDLYDNQGDIKKTLSWLDNNYNKRFFLFFHTYAVHFPYIPPSPYNRKYDNTYHGSIIDSITESINLGKKVSDKEMEHWDDLRKKTPSEIDFHETVRKLWQWRYYLLNWKRVNKDNPRDIKFLKSQYDASINYVDMEMIKPLLNKLSEYGISNNTLLIFTSDHGEAFTEHDNVSHNDLYKETLHVPLIIVYPNHVPKNNKILSLVRLIDIMPTIFNIVGIHENIFMQGQSLLPLIQGHDLNFTCYSSLIRTFEHNLDLKGIRTQRYSYISEKNQFGTVEYLYDRKKDPQELINIIAEKDNTKIIEELKKQLQQEHQSYEHYKDLYAPIRTCNAPH